MSLAVVAVGVWVITESREYATQRGGDGNIVPGLARNGDAAGARGKGKGDGDQQGSHAADCIIIGMDPAQRQRFRSWVEAAAARALDPERVGALTGALSDAEDHVTAGRWGSLIGYDPAPGRRRLVQFDRRGNLVAAFRWRADGALDRAKCLTARGVWLGVEPAAASHPAWGASDRIWLLETAEPWAPREAVTVFQSVDYAAPDFIPPLAEPSRLPPGAGTAVLNLLAALMKDHGVARARYRGPYPTEQLFTSLLESFRYDPAVADPFERFMRGAPLDWLPAPFESHHLAPGLCVHLRQEIDTVTFEGTTFYRTDWQGVVRREPRVVRSDGARVVCSLWALGRSLSDRLVLDRAGRSAGPAPPCRR